MSELTQQIVVGVIVIAALFYVIRWRIRASRTKSGACPKCTIEH